MKRLRILRILLAAVMFVGITLMLLDVGGQSFVEKGVLHPYLGWMAKVQFFPALLSMTAGAVVSGGLIVCTILAITLLIGRVYCSVVCPLGIMQDFLSWLMSFSFLKKMSKRFGKNRFRFHTENKWLRNCVLAVFVILCLVPATAAFAHIIAPYSAYGRMVHALAAPYNTALVVLSVVLFLIIATMACMGGREWCNSICPVGTVLGHVSRFALVRPIVDESKCNKCGKCERNCKAQCIDAKAGTIDTSRCVDCFDCLSNCPQGALHLGVACKEQKTQEKEVVDQSKRQFMGVMAGLAAAGVAQAAKKTDGGLAVIEKKQVPERAVAIKPAGSQSLRHFAQHCTACQLCVSACPNEVLRPSSALATFMQPEMQFDKGYCPVTCHHCADVCPTGAIRLVDETKKAAIQIGHAVWMPTNCVVLTDDVHCGNCAKHCPTGAIQMVEKDGHMVPAVNQEKCIGCGHCEYVCPARPFSAIYVEGHEVQREI